MIQRNHAPVEEIEVHFEELPWGAPEWTALTEAERARRVDDWLRRRAEWIVARSEVTNAEIAEVQRTRGLFGFTTSV